MPTPIVDFERNCATMTDSMETVGASLETLSSASGDLSASADALAVRVTELTDAMERSRPTPTAAVPADD